MNKLALLLTALLSVPAAAEVPSRAAIEMMVAMAQQSEEFSGTAACLGVSPEKYFDSYRRTVDLCYRDQQVRRAVDFASAFEDCVEPGMLQRLARTRAQAEACRSPEEKLMEQAGVLERQVQSLRSEYGLLNEKRTLSAAEMRQLESLDRRIAALEEQQYRLEDQLAEINRDEYQREMDAILAVSADAELSEAQRRRLLVLAEAKMDGHQQELVMTMRRLSEAGRASLQQITLPVYKNSQIMAHAMDMGLGDWGGQLPAATFVSSDTPEQVLAFYRQQLPDFHYKQLEGGEHILMETMPERFGILSHMQEYYSTPHVLIRADQGQPGLTPKDTRSFIEISYRR